MRFAKAHCMLVPLALMFAALSACGSTQTGFSYSPLLLPITFNFDPDGSISISGNVSVVTLIGRFGADVQKADTMSGSPDYTLLTIRHRITQGVVDDIYKIRDREKVEVVLNGNNRVVVENRKVLIDATTSNITSIKIEGAEHSNIQSRRHPLGPRRPRGRRFPHCLPSGQCRTASIRCRWRWRDTPVSVPRRC